MRAAICSQCGGSLEIDEDKEYGFCPNCGTKYYTEKIVLNTVENHYYFNAAPITSDTVVEKRIFDETLTPDDFKNAVLKKLVDESTPADIIKEARFSGVRKGYMRFVRYSGSYSYEWEGEKEETERESFCRVEGVVRKQFEETRVVGGTADKSMLKKFRGEFLSLPSHKAAPAEIGALNLGESSVMLQDDREFTSSLKERAKAQIPGNVRNLKGEFQIYDDCNAEYFMPYYSVEYAYKGQTYLASSVVAKEAVELTFPAAQDRPKLREDKIGVVSLIVSAAFLIAALVIANAVDEGNPVYVLSNVFVAVMAVGIIVCIVRYGMRKKKIAEKGRAQKQKDLDELTNS